MYCQSFVKQIYPGAYILFYGKCAFIDKVIWQTYTAYRQIYHKQNGADSCVNRRQPSRPSAADTTVDLASSIAGRQESSQTSVLATPFLFLAILMCLAILTPFLFIRRS